MVTLTGINKDGIDKLILDILDFAEKVKGNLNAIDDIMLATNSYFNGSMGVALRNKYHELKPNFDIINTNILSYADELNAVKINADKLQEILIDTAVVHQHIVEDVEFKKPTIVVNQRTDDFKFRGNS